MKTHLIVFACLGALALAAPFLPVEYDPDCVEDSDDYVKEVEPIFGEEDALPALGEPDIKIPIDDLPAADADEECEDATDAPDNAPVDPCAANPCAPGCSDDCNACPDLPGCQEPTNGPETATCEDDPVDPVDPCEADPCAEGCPANCGVCPDAAGCQAPTNPPVDPCEADVCAPGCEQPCSECGHLDKCQEVTDEPICEDPITDSPVPDSHPPKPETTKAPETAGTDECVDEEIPEGPEPTVNPCAADPCADGCEAYAAANGVQDCGWNPGSAPPQPATEECVDEDGEEVEPAGNSGPVLKDLVIEPAKQEPDSVLIDNDFSDNADLGPLVDEDCEEEY
jgi:hypothetical protein